MAAQLATQIRSWRASKSMSQLNGHPSPTTSVVAYYHVQDMNGNDYVGLVGSDGENITQHLACTDPNQIINGGAIVVGQSDNVTDVFTAMTSSPAATNVLSLGGSGTTRLVVAYCNGYWCVLIY